MARTCDECGGPSTAESYGLQKTLVLGKVACRCGVSIAIVPVKGTDQLDLCAACAREVMIASLFGAQFFERIAVTVARLVDELDMSVWKGLTGDERLLAFSRSVFTCFSDVPAELQPGEDAVFDMLRVMLDEEAGREPAPDDAALAADVRAAAEPEDEAVLPVPELDAVDLIEESNDGEQEDAEATQDAAEGDGDISGGGEDQRGEPEEEDAPPTPPEE